MKTKLFALLVAVMVVATMLSGIAMAADQPVELIFTSVSVTGDSHTNAMHVFAEKVEELSGGSVTCKVYSDGTLFTQENELDALMTGGMLGGADLAYLSFPDPRDAEWP